jgi:hypothetical protein
MNELIEQFEKQCWGHRIDGTLVDGQLHFDTKKFAELIVRECAMIVEGFEITQEVALDEYVDYEASSVLKEHFGIEE